MTILIPTYNRLKVWERGLLLDSLRRQTVRPDLVLVCDDNSTDGTELGLPTLLAELPFPSRIYRTNRPKAAMKQASALPDNVLFSIAPAEDVWVHLDDDGWIDDDYLERAASLGPGVHFAHITFHHPDTLETLYHDTRERFLLGKQQARLQSDQAWGAAYVCRGRAILDIGGHNMEHWEKLGADARFGNRLSRRNPVWFDSTLRFHHLGPSHFQAAKMVGSAALSSANRLIPSADYTPPLICNGGEIGLRDSLNGLFHLVWEKH